MDPSGTTTATTTTGASSTTETTAVVVPDTSPQTLTPELYGFFVMLFMIVLTIFVLFSTGSILAVLVVWALIGLIVTVLLYYGFVTLESLLPSKPRAPAPPTPRPQPRGGPLVGSEVFHISANQFTYDEAPAVCAAYGAELATLEQIIEAFNHGAEWCGYGWSAGGMALYPTQKKTWTELQREIDPGKRTACGRPGVNGGYFDPSLRFGVNCFGFKPPGEFTPPAPVPGTDKAAFDGMVNRFREMIKTFDVSPFSRREWSGYDSTPVGAVRSIFERFTNPPQASSYGTQFKQDLGRLVEPFETADPSTIEYLDGASGAYDANGPYGLRGPKGDVGPVGPAGPPGPEGAASTVPGPTGPEGAASTVPGPTGAIGPQGPMGPTGADPRLPRPGRPCGMLGVRETRQGQVLRIYTQEECNLLGGRFSANGECTKPGGGSFSWDCRTVDY